MTLDMPAIDAGMRQLGIRNHYRLCELAGVAPSALYKHLAGEEVQLKVARALACALNVRVIDIVDSPYLRWLYDPENRPAHIPGDRPYLNYIRQHPHHEEEKHYGT